MSKPTLKTRAFQEACVFSVVEELAEHLAQWSYSVAFFELSFLPAVRLRNFCKSTKVERFRREMRELIRQVGLLRLREKEKIKKKSFVSLRYAYFSYFRGWINHFYLDLTESTTDLSAVSCCRLRPMQSLQIKNVCQFHFYQMILQLHLFLRFACP